MVTQYLWTPNVPACSAIQQKKKPPRQPRSRLSILMRHFRTIWLTERYDVPGSARGKFSITNGQETLVPVYFMRGALSRVDDMTYILAW